MPREITETIQDSAAKMGISVFRLRMRIFGSSILKKLGVPEYVQVNAATLSIKNGKAEWEDCGYLDHSLSARLITWFKKILWKN